MTHAVQYLFNKFFRPGRRFFRDQLDTWVLRQDSNIRLFGVSGADYAAMTDQEKITAREGAIDQF